MHYFYNIYFQYSSANPEAWRSFRRGSCPCTPPPPYKSKASNNRGLDFSIFTILEIKDFVSYISSWNKGTVCVLQVTLHVKRAMSDLQKYPSKLCRIKYELDINVYSFKNRFFKIKAHFYYSKNIEIIIIKHC